MGSYTVIVGGDSGFVRVSVERMEGLEAAESRCKELAELVEKAADTFELRSEKNWRFSDDKRAGYRESARFLRERMDAFEARTALLKGGDDGL